MSNSPVVGVPALSAGLAPPASNHTQYFRQLCALTAMTEVTQILHQIEQGDPHAASQLLPLVYNELRRLATQRLAQERPGQTLQATALVHEAYLRLVGHDPDQHWDHRGHFFAAAAEAMRRILVERARRKRRRKHGAGRSREDSNLDNVSEPGTRDPLEVLAVHEALDQLAVKAPRKAELVKLRYFLGCTVAEAAQVLGISPATAEGDWTYSKAWLRRQWLRGEQKKETPE
jgi:RNA polymerase sigma factor (TIGR02999 family)